MLWPYRSPLKGIWCTVRPAVAQSNKLIVFNLFDFCRFVPHGYKVDASICVWFPGIYSHLQGIIRKHYMAKPFVRVLLVWYMVQQSAQSQLDNSENIGKQPVILLGSVRQYDINRAFGIWKNTLNWYYVPGVFALLLFDCIKRTFNLLWCYHDSSFIFLIPGGWSIKFDELYIQILSNTNCHALYGFVLANQSIYKIKEIYIIWLHFAHILL